jgi:hypothetical protein
MHQMVTLSAISAALVGMAACTTTAGAPPAGADLEALAARIRVAVGDEEVVFDTSEGACDALDIPDQSARAFRNHEGVVNWLCGHFVLYRETGSHLGTLSRECDEPVWESHRDERVTRFNGAEWLAGTYTDDGETVHAVVHNEFHGQPYAEDPTFNTWYNALTLAMSVDGGRSFTHREAPGHLLLAPGIEYRPEREKGPYGYFEPSNIIKRGDHYYCFVQMEAHGEQQWGTGLLRTYDLADRNAWTVWDGRGWAPIDPETRRPLRPLAPLSRDRIGKLHHSVSFNTHLNAYLMIGLHTVGSVSGIYGTLSRDLVNWSTPFLIRKGVMLWEPKIGGEWSVAYPSLLDPDDTSRNFERSDESAWLYWVEIDPGDVMNRRAYRAEMRLASAPEGENTRD